MAEEVNWDDIKKQIEEGTKKEKGPQAPESLKKKKKQIESVDEILRVLKEKYQDEGAYIKEDELEEKDVDLKELLTPSITISGSPEELVEYESPIVRTIGRIYLKFRDFFDGLLKRMADQKYIKALDWDLYSANLPFTGVQYLVFILVLSTVLAFFAFLISIPFFIRFGPVFSVIGPIVVAFVVFMFAYVFGRSHPRSRAIARSRAAEKQLPFALRHLAVEIRAGMGLYQAMRAVAEADYGVLSEEFTRTLREIDEGKSTEVALSNLAARMKSRGIRRAIANVLRAVRIGGNLSDAIMSVANDVAFEQRMKVAAYGEKLNFFSVIYMFVAVVFPVMLMMLTTVGYAPTGSDLLKGFQLDPRLLGVMYLVVFPAFILLFLFFVRSSDPMR